MRGPSSTSPARAEVAIIFTICVERRQASSALGISSSIVERCRYSVAPRIFSASWARIAAACAEFSGGGGGGASAGAFGASTACHFSGSM